MSIVLEIKPEVEIQLQNEATKQGVDTNGYIVNTLEQHLHRIRLAPPKLNHRESELLRKINLGLPQESWQRYHELLKKRRAETLTANEQAELIAFSDQIEMANARRMEYLVEFAHRQNMRLDWSNLRDWTNLAPYTC